MYNNYKYHSDTRFVPFAAPFLLGALTGGVAISAFRPRPMYPMYNQVYPSYPMYPTYY